MGKPEANLKVASLLSNGISDDFLRMGRSNSTPLSSIESALQEIGIVSAQDKLLSYADLSEWHRGGAETFISTFQLTIAINGCEHRYRLIAKAIVKWGTDTDRIAADWVMRQRRLNEFGVSTPNHFAYWKGILFQEFIPQSLEECFATASSEKTEELLRNLVDTAHRVDRAGFEPISFVEDLRTDGSAIFVVDVGEDLGQFHDNHAGSVAYDRASRWIKKNCSMGPKLSMLLGGT